MKLPEPGEVANLVIHSIETDEALLLYGDDMISMRRGDVPIGAVAGDELKVFLLYDDEELITATTKIPEITLRQPGSFKVINVTNAGSFVDIGTSRDMLIPHRETSFEPYPGQKLAAILYHDRARKRLLLSTRLEFHLKKNYRKFERGQKVSVLVFRQIPGAYRVVIDGQYLAILFEKDCLFRPKIGDKPTGYVRKQEGSDVVVGLQKEGVELLEDAKQRIMNALESSRGYIRLTDDSDPEDIKLRLRISKKTFKKAAGMLYKEGKIELGKRGIKLVKKP